MACPGGLDADGDPTLPATRTRTSRPAMALPIPTAPSNTTWSLKKASDLGLVELASPSGLTARVSPSGALFTLGFGRVMINQFLPGPAEDGFMRLIVRWRAPDGASGWSPVVGPTVAHRRLGPLAHEWTSRPAEGIACTVVLALDAERPAWSWRVGLANTSASTFKVDVLYAQDIGLADEAAVRGNEAFTSQYIDLLPLADDQLGWTVLARQNQKTSEGRNPWLALGCENGAVAYSTDGGQFFGPDHRLTRVPAAVRAERLPSVRLQYECAMPALQSRCVHLYPSATTEVVFLARFVPDHPESSSPADLPRLWEVVHAPRPAASEGAPASLLVPAASLFVSTPVVAGDTPSDGDWEAWFPGDRRHEERGPDGSLAAFFHGPDTHVVSRGKEACIARPHAHILRSGAWQWVDNDQFGLSCYAAGVFAAQAYLGNPNFGRLLPVVRDTLGLGRAAGQRIFVRRAGAWQQLGVPSAFMMTPAGVRWIYKLGPQVLEARVWCSEALSASYLDLRVLEGPTVEDALITHTLALGANELDHGGEITLHGEEQWVACEPDPRSLMGSRLPGTCYAIACAEPGRAAEIGGDELVFADRVSRGQGCVSVRTGPFRRFGMVLCGTLSGRQALCDLVEAARGEWAADALPSLPPETPLRLLAEGTADAVAASRLNEVLPWLVHNAAIHFSAPHGIEQQGGAAWGVRDVCQGSVEWLLASAEWAMVQRILETVFAQQYARDGSWPQWFMHPPFQSIQHAHSHGDVCFWPVKALCDYVEATNDLAFLKRQVGYTDPSTFETAGPSETLLEHCDRMVAHCEGRFVPGTALVNYGDGDWDDTLQPADPAMRTRMISTWTVALAYHTFRQWAEVLGRAGQDARAARVRDLLGRMRRDFAERLMPQSLTAGFLVTEADGTSRALIHPSDTVTGIRYRLLPMTRSVLAELFTPEEARRHMDVVRRELLYPDGARLMSEPATYRGGREYLFKRADTAANVGREIGLLYVHAHLRYAEALAKLGDADGLWRALQVVNPVGLEALVPHAAPRQTNVYFSSSDADFDDRLVAARRWGELRGSSVPVRGGWRLYSSGPGLFIHTVRASLLGLRESFGELVIDPVLPKSLDRLRADVTLCDRPVEVSYRVRRGTSAPVSVALNGIGLEPSRREPNPYRPGGLCFPLSVLGPLLASRDNLLEIAL